MKRYDIINALIKKFNYKTYLEIGTQHGDCYTRVIAPHKVCVDPVRAYDGLTHTMTSDQYFNTYTDKFDIVFIDGLHTGEQTARDIRNALNVLAPDGTIVAHDCLPPTEEHTSLRWCGTTYQAIIELRYTEPEVDVRVVDTDAGCGVIRRGRSTPYNAVPLEVAKTFSYYSSNKQNLMNIISVEEFMKYILS